MHRGTSIDIGVCADPGEGFTSFPGVGIRTYQHVHADPVP